MLSNWSKQPIVSLPPVHNVAVLLVATILTVGLPVTPPVHGDTAATRTGELCVITGGESEAGDVCGRLRALCGVIVNGPSVGTKE